MHASVLLALALGSNAPAAPLPCYTVERIVNPTDPSATLYATAISDNGIVVGWVYPSSASSASLTYSGFRWTSAGGYTSLGAPDDYPNSFPSGVNRDGTIIGNAEFQYSMYPSFAWVRTAAGDYVVPPPLVDGHGSVAAAINEAGTVVGTSNNGSYIHGNLGVYLRPDGTLERIWPDHSAGATAINDAGHIAGHGGGLQPFRYDVATGAYTFVPIPDGDGWQLRSPDDMNNRGDLVGVVARPQAETDYTWIFTDEDGIRVLPPLGRRNYAVAINDDRLVVGNVIEADDPARSELAFIWSPEAGPLPIDLLIPGDDVSVGHASDINNAGQILAAVRLSSGDFFFAVLHPHSRTDVDEDGAHTVADLLGYLARFRAQDERADLDIDEDVDVNDLLTFLAVFRDA